jgi:hypothetical protein
MSKSKISDSDKGILFSIAFLFPYLLWAQEAKIVPPVPNAMKLTEYQVCPSLYIL